MAPQPKHQRMIVPEHVLYRNLNGESVVLDLNSEMYFGMDEIASRMWEVLAASPSIKEACQILQGEYDIEPQILEQDLMDFIHKLVDHGLVQLVS